MTKSSSLFQSIRSSAPYSASIYTRPSDVTGDPKLTTAEKKAVLASWISDARAVENAPSLRRLDSGAVVEVDAILQALVLLDEQAPERRENAKTLHCSDRKRSVISRWMTLVNPSKSPDDNDDDPPPTPAGSGMPFHPTLSRPPGEQPEAGRGQRLQSLPFRRSLPYAAGSSIAILSQSVARKEVVVRCFF